MSYSRIFLSWQDFNKPKRNCITYSHALSNEKPIFLVDFTITWQVLWNKCDWNILPDMSKGTVEMLDVLIPRNTAFRLFYCILCLIYYLSISFLVNIKLMFFSLSYLVTTKILLNWTKVQIKCKTCSYSSADHPYQSNLNYSNQLIFISSHVPDLPSS